MRRGVLAVAVALGLAVGAVLQAATPAAAAEPVTQLTVSSEGDVLSVGLSRLDSGGDWVDPDMITDVGVSVTTPDGVEHPVPVTRLAGADQTRLASVVMLVLDLSGSMLFDDRLPAAKAAAATFIAALPPTVEAGLVTFDDTARVVVRPTLDRDPLSTAVEALAITDRKAHTNLHDGVIVALKALGTRGGDLVLLSDGANDRSSPTQPEAVAKLKASRGTNVYAVAFGDKAGESALRALAEAPGPGAIVKPASDAAALEAVFGNAGQKYSEQVQVTAVLDGRWAGLPLTVNVTAALDGTSIGKSTYFEDRRKAAPASSKPATDVPSTSWTSAVDSTVFIGALVALFLGMTVLVATAGGLFSRLPGRESQVVRRLAVYSIDRRDPRRVALQEQRTEAVRGPSLREAAVGVVMRLMKGRRLENTLDARLDAAGVPLRTAEWMLLHIGVTVGSAMLFLLLGRGRLAAGVVGMLVGFALPWMALSFMTSRRRSAFLGQLPETLQMLAGSLRSGYSLPQAMDTVARESSDPIGSEFNRSLIETRLGMLPEDALSGIAARTSSKDFEWIVMAIRIQREVGGNLAELLNGVAETLRERERLRRQVSALSAEGRLSAWILGLLPLVFTGYLMVARPEYLMPMFREPMGVLLLSGGAALVVIGSLWMRKVVTVEV